MPKDTRSRRECDRLVECARYCSRALPLSARINRTLNKFLALPQPQQGLAVSMAWFETQCGPQTRRVLEANESALSLTNPPPLARSDSNRFENILSQSPMRLQHVSTLDLCLAGRSFGIFLIIVGNDAVCTSRT